MGSDGRLELVLEIAHQQIEALCRLDPLLKLNAGHLLLVFEDSADDGFDVLVADLTAAVLGHLLTVLIKNREVEDAPEQAVEEEVELFLQESFFVGEPEEHHDVLGNDVLLPFHGNQHDCKETH